LFNPWYGDRRPAAWAVILKRLQGGEWQDWDEVVGEAAAVANMLRKSVEVMLYEATRASVVSRRTEYLGTLQSRTVRLIESCPEGYLKPPGEA
jgi:hypothetical protein